MYDVCTELPACIFGNDLFVDLIAMDTKCRFVQYPDQLWTAFQTSWTTAPYCNKSRN